MFPGRPNRWRDLQTAAYKLRHPSNEEEESWQTRVTFDPELTFTLKARRPKNEQNDRPGPWKVIIPRRLAKYETRQIPAEEQTTPTKASGRDDEEDYSGFILGQDERREILARNRELDIERQKADEKRAEEEFKKAEMERKAVEQAAKDVVTMDVEKAVNRDDVTINNTPGHDWFDGMQPTEDYGTTTPSNAQIVGGLTLQAKPVEVVASSGDEDDDYCDDFIDDEVEDDATTLGTDQDEEEEVFGGTNEVKRHADGSPTLQPPHY